MNIANVTERFMAMSGAAPQQMCRWHTLVEDACAYVDARTAVTSPDEAQTRALELLAAAYAYKLYDICSAGGLSSFTAGDVKLTSSATRERSADELWRSLCAEYAELLDNKGFIFGRIVMS